MHEICKCIYERATIPDPEQEGEPFTHSSNDENYAIFIAEEMLGDVPKHIVR